MPDRPVAAGIVIVGAGTAGCVLASTLSADPGRRVVLIDAGPAGPDPALAGLDYLAGADAGRFWEEDLVERVAGQPPRPYRSGRGVGGSAAVNGMVVVPPPAADLAAWPAAGAPVWTSGAIATATAAVGSGWEPTPDAALGPLELALASAASGTGIGTFTPVALERHGERRASVAERLLGPVLDRPNLTVITDAGVSRVATAGDRVVGVDLGDGASIEASEVVLSAGAIRSPLLLAASGLAELLGGGRVSDHPSGSFTLHLRDELSARFQTCGTLRWRTASGATAELLPIARVGEHLAALTLGLMDPISTGVVLPRRGGREVVARLGMLGHERDRRAMREAIGDTLRLLASPAWSGLVQRVSAGALGMPASELLDAADTTLDAWVASTGPMWHAACSLPIGRVLGADGSVPGVTGLRVADASVLPVLPTVAPNGTVAVVAAHLAATWSEIGRTIR